MTLLLKLAAVDFFHLPAHRADILRICFLFLWLSQLNLLMQKIHFQYYLEALPPHSETGAVIQMKGLNFPISARLVLYEQSPSISTQEHERACAAATPIPVTCTSVLYLFS